MKNKIKNTIKDMYFREIVYPNREKTIIRWRKGEVYKWDIPLIEELMKERFIKRLGVFKGFVLVHAAVSPSHSYAMYHAYKTLKADFNNKESEFSLQVLEYHVEGETCGNHCYKVKINGNKELWEIFLSAASAELEEKRGWWIYLSPLEEENYVSWLEKKLYSLLH